MAELVLNVKGRIFALRSRPGPGPNTSVRLADCKLNDAERLIECGLFWAGSPQRLPPPTKPQLAMIRPEHTALHDECSQRRPIGVRVEDCKGVAFLR